MLTSAKHTFRVLAKDPGFTAVAICSLAIGIGATSAMFSFGDALLLRPLPVAEPSSVLAVNTASSAAFGANTAISYPDYVDLRDRNRSFKGLEASSYSSFGFSPDRTTLPRMKFGLLVSGNFFDVLGVQPALGRGFRPDEDKAEGRDAVVVLGHDFWVSQFGGNPSAVGSKIRLNGIDFSVIGVAPERFTGIDQFLRPTMFVPLAMQGRLANESTLNRRDIRFLTVKGRVKPGVTVAQAQSDASAIMNDLERTYPKTNRNERVRVETELQYRVEQSPPNAIMVTMLVLLAMCVLLVACANVAGLLLSRARARSREIAVRLAIGAGRGALVRQLLSENLVVALAGGVLGIGIAEAGAMFFNSLPFPSDLPLVMAVSVDRRVLLFTLAASFLSTLVFGLAPAMRVSRPDLVASLKATDADSRGKPRLWGRNTIVAGQVALSLVLLTVSAVMVQGFRDQLAAGPGFRVDHLFMTSFDTELEHYTDAQTKKFYKDLLDRARSTPGIRSAALTSVIPMIGGDAIGIVPEGYQLPHGEQSVSVFDAYVSEGFFRTMDIRIQQGRGFLETDKENAPLVAVINEQTARHFWPKGDALGRRFHLREATGPLVQIVGIAKVAKYFWIAEPPLDYLYLPYRQNPRSGLTLMAESDAPDAATIAPALRDLVRSLDGDMPTFDVRTMDNLYTQRAVKTPNMITESVAGLGLMGLVLSMVGIYGLVAYSVSRRTREIGIRMAIGADRRSVVWLVLGQALSLGGAGVAVGLVLSVLVSRLIVSAAWIASFSHINPVIFIALPILLLIVMMLATWAPVLRASRLNPMTALRWE